MFSPVDSQNVKRHAGFRQLRSSYNDDAILRSAAVRLRWPLAMAIARFAAHSVHRYLRRREYGRHCDKSHTREAVVADVAHSAG